MFKHDSSKQSVRAKLTPFSRDLLISAVCTLFDWVELLNDSTSSYITYSYNYANLIQVPFQVQDQFKRRPRLSISAEGETSKKL